MRVEGRLGLAIPDSFAEWRAERTATLDAKLKELAKAAAANAIPDAAISDKGLSISPIREEERDRIVALSRRLYILVPRIRITSLLAEVQSLDQVPRQLHALSHRRDRERRGGADGRDPYRRHQCRRRTHGGKLVRRASMDGCSRPRINSR